jgi:hypothetical protein
MLHRMARSTGSCPMTVEGLYALFGPNRLGVVVGELFDI